MGGGGAAHGGNGSREKGERGGEGRDTEMGRAAANLHNFQVSRHPGFPHFSLDTKEATSLKMILLLVTLRWSVAWLLTNQKNVSPISTSWTFAFSHVSFS